MKANRRCSLNLVRTSPEHLMNANEVQHEFSEMDNVKISKKLKAIMNKKFQIVHNTPVTKNYSKP